MSKKMDPSGSKDTQSSIDICVYKIVLIDRTCFFDRMEIGCQIFGTGIDININIINDIASYGITLKCFLNLMEETGLWEIISLRQRGCGTFDGTTRNIERMIIDDGVVG